MFDSVFVAGHRGLVGSAIVRELIAAGYPSILTRTRQEVDLGNPVAVHAFFQEKRPAAVIIAAAKVGGIQANDTYPVEFLLHNLQIQNNLLSASYEAGVQRLLFLGSSCIYPKFAGQPIREDSLLTGPLEPTNEAYAIAKIAGVKLAAAYRRQYGANFSSAMPTNMYGPGDNFDLQTSHVLPALMRKIHEAKERGDATVPIWGTGTPRREFLHNHDLARACRFLLEKTDAPDLVNVGFGDDVTIRELALLICEIVGYEGELAFDPTKPDGTPRKLMDNSLIRSLGWAPIINLRDGIASTYHWYQRQGAGDAKGNRQQHG